MKVVEFFKETKKEMRHVNWPTRKQTMNFTIVVIIISLLVAYFLGLFDFIFTSALEQIL